MRFSWSKPSSYEVVRTLAEEFIFEETSILVGKDLSAFHIYFY